MDANPLLFDTIDDPCSNIADIGILDWIIARAWRQNFIVLCQPAKPVMKCIAVVTGA